MQVLDPWKQEYVWGDVYTNTIDGFCSQLKKSIHGPHYAVFPDYLQKYVDEFAWRYSHRHDAEMFEELVKRI